MDWDKLRIFYAVAEAGSFTHAGETLNLSQSAVSRQISTLEESIGVALFHRHARGLVLTEEGELLQQTAGEIFDKMAMIEGQLADSRQLPKGPLIITAANFFGTTWLAPKLGEFQKELPDIQLTLLLDNRILNLGKREADAAIRLYKPEQPDLVQKHLADIHFHLCASKDYIKAHGTVKETADLKKHTLIGYPGDVPAPFVDPGWIFRLADIERRDGMANIILINSTTAIFEAVKGSAGIAALPDYMIDSCDNLVRLLPDVTRPPVSVYFVYPEERRHSRRIGVFRDFLVQKLGNSKL
jgi:DNA-binding transcriptional LysR family regulator